MKVHARVDERGSRTIVEHTLRNPGDRPLDGLLFLPVPADAVVAIVALRRGDTLVHYAAGADGERSASLLGGVLHDHPRPALRALAGGRVVHAALPGMEPGSRWEVQVVYHEPPRVDGTRWSYVYPLAAGDGPEHASIGVEVRTPHGFRGPVTSPTHEIEVRGGSEIGPCHPRARCGSTNRPTLRVRNVRLEAGPEGAARNFRIEYVPLRADDPGAVTGPRPWPGEPGRR